MNGSSIQLHQLYIDIVCHIWNAIVQGQESTTVADRTKEWNEGWLYPNNNVAGNGMHQRHVADD